MFLSVNMIAGPTVEPVPLAQLKKQCSVDSSFTDDDALITSYGIAAREYCENYTRRVFLPQQWQITLDHFPTAMYTGTVNPAVRRDWAYYSGIWQGMTIAPPKPKCISVDSITYVDITGTQQTLASTNYKVDINSTPARIVPAPGLYWPLNTLYIPGSVAVSFTAGSYADASHVPLSICQAIMLMVSHWYNNRETASINKLNDIPFGVTALLDMYKVSAVLDYESIV
jgi:uncharacterized phiE125 gp8 family phage protein